MGVYLGGLVVSLIFTMVAVFTRKRKKQFVPWAILSGLPFVLIGGFRYYVGADFRYYYGCFYHIKEFGYYGLWEVGYNLLNKFVLLFTNDSMFLFLLVEALITGFTFLAIYQLSCNPVYSILIWFLSMCFFEGLNTMRQSLALAIFFCSIYFIKQRKIIPYIIVVIFASAMHQSALFLIPVYFIARIEMTFLRQATIGVAAVISAPIIGNLIQKIPMLSKYTKYLISVSNMTDFRVMDFMIALFIWLVSWYFYKYIDTERKNYYQILVNLQFLYLLLSSLSGVIPLAYRLMMYFTYINVFLYPEILITSKRKINTQFLLIIMISIYILQFYIYVAVIGNRDYFSYQSIFG